MIGIGAGQQSRVDCTKLSGAKADVWHLGRHPKVLGLRFKKGVKRQERINWRVRYIEGDLVPSEEAALGEALDQRLGLLTGAARLAGVSRVSDASTPSRDTTDRAARHGVKFIAQPGGATRDAETEAACLEH